MSIVNKVLSMFLGNKSDRDLKDITPVLALIKSEYEKIQTISNDELRKLSFELKSEIRGSVADENAKVIELKATVESPDMSFSDKESVYKQIDKLEKDITEKIESALETALPRAFAIVKETAKRFTENDEVAVKATDFDRDLAAKFDHITIDDENAVWRTSWLAGGNEIKWEMVHYDVQLIGGTVLHRGNVAEMATGEGKTLVATLPVFLNALSGRGVHVVTVNDYLAKRDSEWMAPIFEFHGLSVDCIDKHQPNSEERRKAYASDITYGTNNEFGFDYLRDNMAISPEDLVQRPHNYAIVDEVDSVLIDDARTPLIISGPIPKGDDQQFAEYKPRIQRLVSVQKDLCTKILAEAKRLLKDKKTEEEGAKLLLRTYKGLPKSKPLIKFLSEEGIKSLLTKTENAYMQNNNEKMPQITDELYFVIDEKNNSIELTDKGHDLITADVEDSGFFVMPDIGSEIAELEKEEISDADKAEKKEELMREFSIKSERVHTVNQLLKAYTLFENDVEYVVQDNKVKIVDEQTGRIMEGRRYSDGLHQAIEAKENVKVEAATQTFATITLQNYFRMYNKLSGMTGTAETEAGELWDIYKLDVIVIPTNRPIQRLDSHDLVYKTKREKYTAVAGEIVNLVEEGRPVLVGTTSVEISELLSRTLKMRGIKHNVLNAKLHQREADIVAEAGKEGTVTIATNMAGRGTDIKISDKIKDAGGLAIIGTERHESRRVDRQLRGRSGRQGDPGTSQFFVSLEDDLMRLFGSDRISGIMDRLGLKEGEVIQHSMISKSIERAQRKVEENNFGIRKRLLEYDDVMNSQREVIYTKRRNALYGDRIDVDIANMMQDLSESIVEEYQGNIEFADFNLELLRLLSVQAPFTENEFLKDSASELSHKLYKMMEESYLRKVNEIAQKAFPVIKGVYEEQGATYDNIVVPISDGQKMYRVIANLKKSYESDGKEIVKAYQKTAVLATIDEFWKEHLRELDDLKQSVQNASYEQKDPLLIYKFESFNLFRTMLDKINRAVVALLLKGFIPLSDGDDVHEAQERRRTDMSRMQTSRTDGSDSEGRGEDKPKPQPVRTEKKVGRNEPCPCGSGKKFKNCHGKGESA
jgi:preprotein translocase subunit SecA